MLLGNFSGNIRVEYAMRQSALASANIYDEGGSLKRGY
jgi:hypothetical protein